MEHSKIERIFKDASSDDMYKVGNKSQQLDQDTFRRQLNRYFEDQKAFLLNAAKVKQEIQSEIGSLIEILKKREIQLCLEVDQRCHEGEVDCLQRFNLIKLEDGLNPSPPASSGSLRDENRGALIHTTPLGKIGFTFLSDFAATKHKLEAFGMLVTDEKVCDEPSLTGKRRLNEVFPELLTPTSPKSMQTITKEALESEDTFEMIDPVEVPPLEILMIVEKDVKSNITMPRTTQTSIKSKLREDSERIYYCGKILSDLLAQNEHCYPVGAANNMRNLIQDVIDGTIQPDEFLLKLKKDLDCVLPHHLQLHLLFKNCLPYIRHALITRELTLKGIYPPPTGTFMLSVPPPNLQKKQDEDDGIEVISKDGTEEDSASIDSCSIATPKTLSLRERIKAQLKSLRRQRKCQQEEKDQVKLPSCQLTTTTKCLQFLNESSLADVWSECPDLITKEEERPLPSVLLISSFKAYLTKDNYETWLSPRSVDDKSEWLPSQDSTNRIAHLKDSPEKWLSTKSSLDKWLRCKRNVEKIASGNDDFRNWLYKKEKLNNCAPSQIKIDEWIAPKDNSGRDLLRKEIPASNLFCNLSSNSLCSSLSLNS